MNAAPLDATDLQQALDGRFPYNLLSASLQQRLSQHEYHAYTVKHSILRWHAYHRLPDFVKPTITEAAYYEAMVQYGGEQLQLYPYVHQKQILFYTRETALSYYIRMVAEMLKAERSYDRLPNFTANDILNLLGIGRNQYLNVTKEVRSKLRWHVNRSYVPEHLPSEFLSTVAVEPFWAVVPVVEPPSQLVQQLEKVSKLCRGNPEDAALFRLLLSKGSVGAVPSGTGSSSSFALSSSFTKASSTDQQLLESLQVSRQVAASDVVYACQLPCEAVQRLYRKALVCADFTVSPDDLIVVPPLGNFVMNRTSEEPLELLLYRVLSTLDDRTPLQLLAQLLMVSEEDICAAVHALIRLGLAKQKVVQVPETVARNPASVHPSWQPVVARVLAQPPPPPPARRGWEGQEMSHLASEHSRAAVADTEALLPGRSYPAGQRGAGVAPEAGVAGDARDGPQLPLAHKRIALLYDATLTGFLMMTNLSRNPVFKQHAVTLFEVGKMPDEMVGSFLDLLNTINAEESQGFGGEALKYISSAVSLRELLKVLRAVPVPDSGGVRSGVDMLKIESLNELEATTRYSVLGRNYWAYVVTTPIATAPYIDVELSCVYGNTASLMASPWLLLFLHEKLKQGPPTLMLPFGSQLHCWPPEFHDVQEPPGNGGDAGCGGEAFIAKVRMQTIALDAEVSHADMDTSLLLVNEMAVTAPVVVQCVAPTPVEAPALSRGRRDAGPAESPSSFGFFEVTLPFTATPEDAQRLLISRATEELLSGSRAVPHDAAAPSHDGAGGTAPGTAPTDTITFQDKGKALLYKTVEMCVDALHLRDSLGYLTCCVSFHALSSVAAEEGWDGATRRETSSGRTFAIDRVDIVDLGLGISLTHRDCCACALQALPHLLSDESTERHNAAVRSCVDEFSAFLERYSTLTRATYGKLALRSAGVTGPMTQQHLRKVGGGGAAPFPATTIVFTGQSLHIVDDANPLSEQWSI